MGPVCSNAVRGVKRSAKAGSHPDGEVLALLQQLIPVGAVLSGHGAGCDRKSAQPALMVCQCSTWAQEQKSLWLSTRQLHASKALGIQIMPLCIGVNATGRYNAA